MTPVLLIAGNFIRENRWPILVLLIWGVASGAAGVVMASRSADDALFFLKQQAVYSVFFTVFLSSSALHNQRRTRRILAVLSKGIERYQYLTGIALGYTAVSLVYATSLGITGAMTFGQTGASAALVLPLMIFLLIASILAGTIALFFSTFMNPLFSLASTSVVLGTSAMMGGLLGYHVIPGLAFYPLVSAVTEFSFNNPPQFPWWAAAQGVVETLLFLLAASWIFSRRDVAVPVE
jgi:hypothetical protein